MKGIFKIKNEDILKSVKFIEYSRRLYGQPKLTLPKELKGIKQWDSVDYIPKKCKCMVYIKGTDIWIKHRDYFSSSLKTDDEDFGAPLEVLVKKYCTDDRSFKRFAYPDAWGAIVLRNEAWLKIDNLIIAVKENIFPPKLLNQILRDMEKTLNVEEYELECSDMSRMFERLIYKLRKYENEGE